MSEARLARGVFAILKAVFAFVGFPLMILFMFRDGHEYMGMFFIGAGMQTVFMTIQAALGIGGLQFSETSQDANETRPLPSHPLR